MLGKGERFKEYPKLQELIRLKVSPCTVCVCDVLDDKDAVGIMGKGLPIV